MDVVHHFISLFLLIVVVTSVSPLRYGQVSIAYGSLNSGVENDEWAGAVSIGAIFDETSRPGKEAKVALEIVVHDLDSDGNQDLIIHYGNSQGKPVRAALAGKFIFTNYVNRIQ